MKWHTVKEAAEILRVSRGTVYGMCAAGTLYPVRRVGLGRGKILISDVALAEGDRRTDPPAEPQRVRKVVLKHLSLGGARGGSGGRTTAKPPPVPRVGSD